MKRLLLAVAVMITSVQGAEPDFDPNSPGSLEAKAKYDGYTRDGQALRTADLYKELERLDAAKKSRVALNPPKDLASAMFSVTDDDVRAIAYEAVLKKRGEGGDPYASFFYGVHQWDYCLRLQRLEGEAWAKQANECWQGVLPAFKRASAAKIADASFNIAKLYENGFGVAPSKLVAAEWYVKSAEQYNKEKSREEALAAVEKAVDLVPDHPAALRMRKSMLK